MGGAMESPMSEVGGHSEEGGSGTGAFPREGGTGIAFVVDAEVRGCVWGVGVGVCPQAS